MSKFGNNLWRLKTNQVNSQAITFRERKTMNNMKDVQILQIEEFMDKIR